MGVPSPRASSTNDDLLLSGLKAIQSLKPGTTDAAEIAVGHISTLWGGEETTIFLFLGGKWTRGRWLV